MPQMAPLMWLTLFIFFLMMYLLFNIMNYFSYIIESKTLTENKSINSSSLNWKW
uniref:ATP synthase complex subunit 8 n=1 Tax=Micropygomyia cayennensis TaxID=237255 RepID=A0A343AWA3_9DIPT|nr:ATP synthase F0 subunit 8 [Micropygomyia cayennensis]